MSKPVLYVFKYQAQILCESFMCIFFWVYWLEMLCVHMNVPPIRAGKHNRCKVFTVIKIVFYENLDHAWDQVYNKS